MSEPDVLIVAAYSGWLNTILETHAKQLWDAADGDSDDKNRMRMGRFCQNTFVRRFLGRPPDLFSLVDNEKFADADRRPIPSRSSPNFLKKRSETASGMNCLSLLRRPPRFIPVIKFRTFVAGPGKS